MLAQILVGLHSDVVGFSDQIQVISKKEKKGLHRNSVGFSAEDRVISKKKKKQSQWGRYFHCSRKNRPQKH